MNYDWKDIFKESFPVLTVTAFVGILGGQMLNSIEGILIQVPVILFVLPIINGVGGNLGIVLGARISSGLHSGYITPDIKDEEMLDNMTIALFMGGIIYLVVAGAVASLSTTLRLNLLISQLFLIIIGTGIILTLSIIFITITVTLWSYKKKLDPDNIVVPVVTTSGDFIGISSLLFMVWLVIIW